MITYEIYAKFRDSLGYKDADVARSINTHQSTFSDWKKGKSKPKHDKLEKIRELFGMNMFEFYSYGMEVPASIAFAPKETGPKLDNLSNEMLERFNKLDDESKRNLLAMAAFLCDQQNKKEK